MTDVIELLGAGSIEKSFLWDDNLEFILDFYREDCSVLQRHIFVKLYQQARLMYQYKNLKKVDDIIENIKDTIWQRTNYVLEEMLDKYVEGDSKCEFNHPVINWRGEYYCGHPFIQNTDCQYQFPNATNQMYLCLKKLN